MASLSAYLAYRTKAGKASGSVCGKVGSNGLTSALNDAGLDTKFFSPPGHLSSVSTRSFPARLLSP